MNSSIILWTGQGIIFKCIFIHVWRKVSDLQLLDYWKMHMWLFPWHDRITKPPELTINLHPAIPSSKEIDPHLPWKSFFRKRLPYFMRGETLCTCSNSKSFGGMWSLNICIELDQNLLRGRLKHTEFGKNEECMAGKSVGWGIT